MNAITRPNITYKNDASTRPSRRRYSQPRYGLGRPQSTRADGRSGLRTPQASTEAAIRRKIRRLLREHEYKPPVAPPGGGSVQDINHFAQLVLDQAKTLYRYWPDVEGRLFE
jgi:hypothetical protein